MGHLGLQASQRRYLQQQLRQAATAVEYRRLVAMLELDDGTAVREVARWLRVSEQSIYNWIARLGPPSRIRTATGPDVRAWLRDHPRTGRPTVWTEAHVACLRCVLASPPEHWGYFATGWTVPLLQDVLHPMVGQWIADTTLRRALHQLGYAWTRGRYRLTPDPAAEKKTRNSPSPPASVARAAAQRSIGRRRNRSAVVSGAARGLGRARAAA